VGGEEEEEEWGGRGTHTWGGEGRKERKGPGLVYSSLWSV